MKKQTNIVDSIYSLSMIGELKGVVKDYDWGFTDESEVLDWSRLSKSNFSFWAELWFGTHVNGTSEFKVSSSDFSKLSKVTSLGYMFKVLSAKEALSIQIHPSKDLARRLNQSKPDIYKDSNHKPELAIAITTVELLHGVKGKDELKEIFSLPEYDSFEFDKTLSFDDYVQRIFNKVLDLGSVELAEFSKILQARLCKQSSYSKSDQVLLKLLKKYPNGDHGLVFYNILNFIELSPGEAIFTQPSMPHAYLSGELYEFLGESDNVIRVGLTSKLRDKTAMLEAIKDYDYELTRLAQLIDDGEGPLLKYDLPIDDFNVEVCKEEAAIEFQYEKGLLIVENGSGSMSLNKQSISLSSKSVYFMTKGAKVDLKGSSPKAYLCY